MSRIVRPVLALTTLLGALTACDKVELMFESPPPAPFEVLVHVTSDPGKAVTNAELKLDDKTVGKTDSSGAAKAKFNGKDGDSIDLSVKCPVEFESPALPISVTLRRLAEGSRVPTYEVRCPPAVRSVVVGIRTENGANLPVLRLGRPVARTDAAGTAHLLLSVKPGEQVDLTLSTAEKGSEQLRPQNPMLMFIGKNRDDFVVLEQKFTAEKKAAPVRQGPRPPRPTPL